MSNESTVSLSSYGDVTTLAGAQGAFQQFLLSLPPAGSSGPGHGCLVISADTHRDFLITNSLPQLHVVDLRNGTARVQASLAEGAISGGAGYPAGSVLLRKERTSAQGGLFGSTASVVLLNRTVHGGRSVRCALIAEIAENTSVESAKFYPEIIEGIYVGLQLAVEGANSTYRVTVKSIQWDAEKVPPAPYFTVEQVTLVNDTTASISQFASISKDKLVGNKSNHEILELISEDHCGNQNAGLTIRCNGYSDGDRFGSTTLMRYQGNIMSAGGDEGSVGHTVEIEHDLNIFRANVSSFDVENCKLVYASAINSHALATMRSLINLNKSKWITQGAVQLFIGRVPDAFIDRSADPPTATDHGVVVGVGTNWSPDIIGRYFAIDGAVAAETGGTLEFDPVTGRPIEYFVNAALGSPENQKIRRWFRIAKLETRGKYQYLWVHHIRWSAQLGTVPMMDTRKGYYEYIGGRLFKYVIAPGAVVCDVSEGLAEKGNVQASNCTVRVQPNGDFRRGNMPFAPGDAVELAVGAFPWNPSGFRVRHFTKCPSNVEDASFAAYNNGSALVNAGLLIHSNLDAGRDRAAQLFARDVAYRYGVHIGATCEVGAYFSGDLRGDTEYKFLANGNREQRARPDAGLAVLFHQRAGIAPKLIAWNNRRDLLATLGFDPQVDEFRLQGGLAVDVDQAGLTQVRGISKTATRSNNLRGISVAVPAAATSLKIWFLGESESNKVDLHEANKAADSTYLEVDANRLMEADVIRWCANSLEPDGQYAVFVTPSWGTMSHVTGKTRHGFTIHFGTAATTGCTLDWMVVR